jgi:carbon storage regulator
VAANYRRSINARVGAHPTSLQADGRRKEYENAAPQGHSGDSSSDHVLGVKGTQVRLGFAAPLEVAVHREEVYLRLRADRSANRHAKEEGTGDLALV